MASKEEIYANRIFLNAALPLLKPIAESSEKLKKKFRDTDAIVQVSALDENGKAGTHFIIKNGEWTVAKGTAEKPDLELEFKSIGDLNGFFSGKSKKLPKLKGLAKHPLLFVNFLGLLLTMAKLLGTSDIPEKEEDRQLLVKLYFYLLSSGISQLNKAGHPEVSKWAKSSPDRVYAWSVDGSPELSAYIRVKAGNTKACRGQYTRSKPFFTMRFNTTTSALGILLSKDEMLKSTAEGKLIMEGAPEFGAQLGEYMMLVGSYAK
jgi:hypothetical protein